MFVFRPERFKAVASLNLNGKTFEVVGNGHLNKPDGTVEGEYHWEALPEFVDPYFLKCVMVTGYPSVCRSKTETSNPFKAGSYSYCRRVDFGKSGFLEYRAVCSVEQDSSGQFLDSQFVGVGELSLPSLGHARPIIEEWIPRDDFIEGRFEIVWPLVSDNGEVCGIASTHYSPPSGVELCSRMKRHIDFPKASKSERSFSLTQSSYLF